MGDCGTVANLSETYSASPPASEPISVLVTGFGPFKSNAVNASHLIAASLPSSITLPTKGPSATPREILVHAHPSPIPVAYASVRTELPAILEDFAQKHNGRRPDLIVHMGIASTRGYYSVETQAHRDNYQITDIHGKIGFEDGEKLWKEKGLPALLKPGPAKTSSSDESDTVASPAVSSPRIVPYPAEDHFLETWKSYAPPGTDIRISEDAGRYLCEFIFYTSLSEALQEGRDRASVFFHVPSWTDEQSLETGRQVAIALIKAMVTCWIDEAPQSQQPT